MSDDDPVTTPILEGDDPLPPEQEALVMKIIAICWEQFGKKASKQVDDDCYDKAVALGALKKLRDRIRANPVFTKKDLKAVKWCSSEAGKTAGLMAGTKGERTISAEIYEAAFKKVADEIKDKHELRIRSVFCA